MAKRKNHAFFRKNRIKVLFLCFFVLISCIAINQTYFFYKVKHKIQSLYDKREPWITVFVHGNFNTGLGFLSFRDVLKDNLQSSAYRKIIKKIRKDPFFYQEQPILEKGLVRIEPSFTPPKTGEKLATHPIMSGYQEVLEEITPGKKNSFFYTFGWSGLMSQTVRKRWAIRFYNALSEEIKKFNDIGIHPRVRIIAHSHGGNVALSLATIRDVINDVTYKKISSEGKKYFSSTSDLLKKLISYEPAKNLKGQKQFDYTPVNKELYIDELVILGTPIQEDTTHGFSSEVFGKVYSIYSEQDVIQGMDFVSSAQGKSKQRLEASEFIGSKLIQAKIMIEKDLKSSKYLKPSFEKKKNNFWNKVGKFFSTQSKDPTHKDLWFLAWNPDFCQPGFPLNPLPLVVITPMLIKALNTISDSDVDLNIRFLKKHLKIDVIRHNETKAKNRVKFPIQIIKNIKEKTMPWKPNDLSRATTFKKMYARL